MGLRQTACTPDRTAASGRGLLHREAALRSSCGARLSDSVCPVGVRRTAHFRHRQGQRNGRRTQTGFSGRRVPKNLSRVATRVTNVPLTQVSTSSSDRKGWPGIGNWSMRGTHGIFFLKRNRHPDLEVPFGPRSAQSTGLSVLEYSRRLIPRDGVPWSAWSNSNRARYLFSQPAFSLPFLVRDWSGHRSSTSTFSPPTHWIPLPASPPG